jgi:hypothetical protein
MSAASPVAAGDGMPILEADTEVLDPVEVDIEAPPPEMVDGVEIQESPDGGVIIDLEPEQKPSTDPEAMVQDANLAEYMPESVLNGLAESLMQAVDADDQSRSDWKSMMQEGIKYLGLNFEDRSYPFQGASGVFDTIMLEAVIRWHATATAELLPASGPVKTQIVGIPSEETDAQASRVKEFMNYYLTEGAPEYVEENDQMLMWLPLVGSTFKKTYQDPILNRPVSSFIQPENLIVNYGAADIDTATRVTHEFTINQRELKMRQLAGFYRDIDLGLPEPDAIESGERPVGEAVDRVQGTQKSLPTDPTMDITYRFREVHADIDLEGFEHRETGDDNVEAATGLPLPYIVTIDTSSRKVLSVRRNWREGDSTYEKVGYFTHFKFVPGLGFYGYGYAHILGNPAKSSTALQRQMIDAATLAMFPGGLRVKGMRMDNNNQMIAPCTFPEIDTGGLPISQAIMAMPYRGPDEVSLELSRDVRNNAKSLAGTSEIAVGEGRQDAPVGTTVALLEAANRPQSSTIKNCHRAFRREFKLIAALFGQFLPDRPYPFPVSGGSKAIMRADFNNNIDVIPVSDPNITSSAQRMMRAEALLRFATQAPAMHNQYEAFKQMYVEMGVDPGKIEKLLLKPEDAQPLDPLSENQNALIGKPVKAAEYQDHDAHIQSHAPLMETVPTIQAHIAEHMALKMRVQVQNAMGVQLPPAGTKLPPEIENQIAMGVAQSMQSLNKPQGENPTPEQVAMEQVKVEGQKVAAKLAETKAKTQTEAFKAQMKAQSEEEDRRTRILVTDMQIRAKRADNAAREAQQFSQRRKF